MINIDWHRFDRIYLGIDPPYPDETFSSVVNRAACLYGISPNEVISRLFKDRGMKWERILDADEWDNPIFTVKRAVMGAFSQPGVSGPATIRRDHEDHLLPQERCCYCVLCFRDDVREGRTPYFRSAWSRVTRTYCDVHRCPLVADRIAAGYGTWWTHPWCKAATRRERPKSPAYGDLMKQAQEFENYCLDADSKWPGKAVSQRVYDWELKFTAEPGDWYLYKLLIWLAYFPGAGAEARRWGSFSELMPRPNGWHFGSPVDEVSKYQRNPRFLTWRKFQNLGSPEKRRAIFLVAACCFEKDVPIQDLGLWPKDLKSCTTEWWKWVAWHRLSQWSQQMGWLQNLAYSVQCDIRDLDWGNTRDDRSVMMKNLGW